MTVRVVLEDPDFVIVEKPEGIATQRLPVRARFPRPGRGKPAPTLAHLVAVQFPEIKDVGGDDWGAVHRLDRETSGLVVFARNQETYDTLRAFFSKTEVEKEYTALVEGVVKISGRIEWPIGSDPKSAKRVKVYKNIKDARRNKAQEAVTIYVPQTSPPAPLLSKERVAAVRQTGEVFTLLRILIKTGRRHQIRAHLAAIGHPIVGDGLYGGPQAERLFLHASRLRFRHPRGPRNSRWVEAVWVADFAAFEEPPSVP